MFKLYLKSQIANICWVIEKKNKENSRKNIYFCFIDYTKDFVWITTNWKILKEKGLPPESRTRSQS